MFPDERRNYFWEKLNLKLLIQALNSDILPQLDFLSPNIVIFQDSVSFLKYLETLG